MIHGWELGDESASVGLLKFSLAGGNSRKSAEWMIAALSRGSLIIAAIFRNSGAAVESSMSMMPSSAACRISLLGLCIFPSNEVTTLPSRSSMSFSISANSVATDLISFFSEEVGSSERLSFLAATILCMEAGVVSGGRDLLDDGSPNGREGDWFDLK